MRQASGSIARYEKAYILDIVLVVRMLSFSFHLGLGLRINTGLNQYFLFCTIGMRDTASLLN